MALTTITSVKISSTVHSRTTTTTTDTTNILVLLCGILQVPLLKLQLLLLNLVAL